MTTHDEQTNTSTSHGDLAPPAQPEVSGAETEASTAQPNPAHAAHDDPSSATARTDSTQPHAEPEAGTASSTAETEPSTDKALFAGHDLSGLRARWDDLQVAFVDDPKQCVQKADALVAEVVEQLTTGFADARSRLEAQWARGQEASTEDLRLALKRYREFFQRLLSI